MATDGMRASSGFRNLPNPYAFITPRLVFTTLAPKEAAQGPYANPSTGKPMHCFSLDHVMCYTPFRHDHGPLNLAYTFEACARIFEKISENKRKTVCLYTSPNPEPKSNLAVIAALYTIIVEHKDPWDAFQPIAHFELLPFRDAGNGTNDFALTAQDILYGMWKAFSNDLLVRQDFEAETYRYYERVENGDLNNIGNFIAFASPMDPCYIAEAYRNQGLTAPEYASETIDMLAGAFQKVHKKFEKENVGVVVRLNDDLYDSDEFVERGIKHVDLYFDDGSNPTDDIVREFIKLTEETFAEGKKVAVHCKAGLGRTGVLIGAYLIYKYQFTATEVIGYMRVLRPGMVVGPQQHYMQLNQMKWAGWAIADALSKKETQIVESLPSPPLECDRTLDDMTTTEDATMHPLQPTRRLHKAGDAVGQPRKGVGSVPDAPLDVDQEDVVTPTRAIKSDAPSPQTVRIDSNTRGIKRGSGRSPLPSSIRGETPALVIAPSSSSSTLARSSSNASCASSASELDQRATKRRTGDSPPATSGLSSPPPSRDTTPSDELASMSFPFPIQETEEPPSTPPKKPVTLDAISPPATEHSAAKVAARSRSLIPRLGSSQKLSTAHSRSQSMVSLDEAATPRSKLPTRKLLGPPRVWDALPRFGTAPE